ncbi:MAG: ABC transporter substrate-binding protein [Acidimicrobiales bacterium]|nr:ABC transporter substrate-binding protein [Acidimicrobiales bacterium]
MRLYPASVSAGRAWLILTLAACLGVSACSPGPVGDADGELVIGTLLPLTGDSSEPGLAARDAVNAQIVEIAAATEFDDTQVRLVHADVRTDGKLLAAAVEELIANNVDVVIGPPTHGQNSAVGQQLAATGTVIHLPLAESTSSQARMMADAVLADGHTALALVTGSSTATDAAAIFTERLSENGGSLLADVELGTTEEGRFDPEVAQIAAAPSTAIVLLGLADPQRFVDALTEAGVGPGTRTVYVVGNTHSVSPTPGLRLVEPAGSLADQVVDRLVIASLASAAAGTDDPSTVAAQLSSVVAGETACASFANCLKELRENQTVAFSATAANAFTSDGQPTQVPYRLVAFTPDGQVNEELTRIITSS